MNDKPDDYLKLGGTGWGELQKLISGQTVDPAELERQKADAEERRHYFENLTYRAFSTGDARIWLIEYLKHVTVEQPCYVLGTGPELGFIREGQNSVYRYIRDCIRNVEGRMKPGRKPKQIPL